MMNEMLWNQDFHSDTPSLSLHPASAFTFDFFISKLRKSRRHLGSQGQAPYPCRRRTSTENGMSSRRVRKDGKFFFVLRFLCVCFRGDLEKEGFVRSRNLKFDL